MRKKIFSMVLITFICFSLAGCDKFSTGSIVENLNRSHSFANDELTTTISVKNDEGEISLKLSGIENQKGLYAKVEQEKEEADYEELTNIYFTRDGFYVETGNENLQDLVVSFLDDNIYLPEDSVIFFEPYNEYVDIQNINPKIVRKYINQGLAEELKTKDKDFVKKDKNVYSFTIGGEELKTSLLHITNYMEASAESIFNDYYNLVDEDTKKKMNSSKEYTIKQIKASTIDIKEYIESIDFSNVTLTYKNTSDKNVVEELLKIENTNGNFIDIHNIIKEAGELEIPLPEDITPVSEVDFYGESEYSERSQSQIEEFYDSKYPESSRIKKIIKSLGYTSPQLSTSLKEVIIYATRESRSIDMKHNIPDEISVIVENDWLSTITITNSFSLNDYNLYGSKLIQQTANEISSIIDSEFLVEIPKEFGSFENVTEHWEFFAEIIKVDIQDNDGLITVKLTANQH